MSEFENMVKKQEEIEKYKKAYNILMDYFNCIPEEEKIAVDAKLKALDL